MKGIARFFTLAAVMVALGYGAQQATADDPGYPCKDPVRHCSSDAECIGLCTSAADVCFDPDLTGYGCCGCWNPE